MQNHSSSWLQAALVISLLADAQNRDLLESPDEPHKEIHGLDRVSAC